MSRDGLRLVGISGSLRARSYNTALLHAVRAVAPDDVGIDIVLADLPLFNEDLLASAPPSVERLWRQVRAADGLVLACPEYNGGITGALKNTLDWLSVPFTESALRAKPVALVGASNGRLGTARAQTQLRSVLGHCGARVVAGPEVLVAGAAGRFDEELRLVDERAPVFLRKLLDELVAEIRLLQRATPVLV